MLSCCIHLAHVWYISHKLLAVLGLFMLSLHGIMAIPQRTLSVSVYPTRYFVCICLSHKVLCLYLLIPQVALFLTVFPQGTLPWPWSLRRTIHNHHRNPSGFTTCGRKSRSSAPRGSPSQTCRYTSNSENTLVTRGQSSIR